MTEDDTPIELDEVKIEMSAGFEPAINLDVSMSSVIRVEDDV